MTDIRQAAMDCEVRKIAYRQSKDGMVVAFVVHPNDMPDALATAELGTRYRMALVEIGDDEQPVMRKDGEANNNTSPPSPSADDPPGKAAGAKKSWDELSPPQQAGILCADPVFWKFLGENFIFRERYLQTTGGDEERAARNYVCSVCGVTSRSEITSDNTYWLELVAMYRAWQREPEVIG